MIADQCGFITERCRFVGFRDNIELYNQTGFCEWNKFIDCQIHKPARYGFRFRLEPGNTLDSFRGTEIRGLWMNLVDGPGAAAAASRAFHTETGTNWYNGVVDAEIMCGAGLDQPQYIFTSAAGAKPVELRHLSLGLESPGSGQVVITDSNNFVYANGGVSTLAGVKFGNLYLTDFIESLGPEAGVANGQRMVWRKPYGQAVTGLTTGANTTFTVPGGGAKIMLRFHATNYEYRIYGVAEAQGFGGAGRWVELDAWAINNGAGYGKPTMSVDSNGALVITNAGFPVSGVACETWIEQILNSPLIYSTTYSTQR